MYPFTFDHIHYKSQSFDSTKKFYIDVMGATDQGFVELGGKSNLQLELAGMTLLFVDDPKASTTNTEECGFPCNVPPWDTRHGVFHIAVLVDNCNDATEYFSNKAKEVYDDPELNIIALGPIMASDNIRASFLYAPDGMAVELKENLS
ncbi:MAG: hypothetical protein P8P74_03995 [Crocinitomicaceae bacterium]|nr:hypothetical protein [Crocinitomicaceae bacterium]